MTQITELGYLGLGVKDVEAWKKFASETIGLEVVNGDTPNSYFLRNDNNHHRIILQEDDLDDVIFVGLRVAGVIEFKEMFEQLKAAGIDVKMGSKGEAKERHVLEIMILVDPNGIPLEIFHGPHMQPNKPFHPGRRMHGRFKTGDGGLGHMLISNKVSLEENHKFYSLLGMRGSIEYKMPMGDGNTFDLMFMDCNSRDHTLAFGQFPGPDKRIHHILFEYEGLNDVGLAYEMTKINNVPVPMMPGRHANDEMYSFYMESPSGFLIELGYGARNATYQSEYFEADTFRQDDADKM